jgi:hypothetical protein
MKGLLLLYGESFRDGGQHSRLRDTKASYIPQQNASQSHIAFCKHIQEKHNIDMDIIINTHDTKYESQLKKWYAPYKYISSKSETITSVDKLVQDAVNAIDRKYEFVFMTRMDIYLKPLFLIHFNPQWSTIKFFSHNFTLWNCGIDGPYPRVNPTCEFIPKKYFQVLYNVSVQHSAWRHYHEIFHIPNSKLGFMVNTYHDANTFNDFNPYYKMISRPESMTWHDAGKKINKSFGKTRKCKKTNTSTMRFWKSKKWAQTKHLPVDQHIDRTYILSK